MAATGAALRVSACAQHQQQSFFCTAATDPNSTLSLSRSASASPCLSLFRPTKRPHSSRWHRRHFHLRKCVITRVAAASADPGVGTKLQESITQSDLLHRALELGFAWPGVGGGVYWLAIAAPAVLWYIAAAAPGSVWGLVDYAYAPVHSLFNTSFDANEVQVGRQIGQGSFGIVYEGFIGRGVRKVSEREELHVILKKVKPRIKDAPEMHSAEVYMNRRVQRTAPNACADFLGTTVVKSSEALGRLSEGLWLVWRYEGDKTLNHYLQQKNFPQNIADIVLGSKVKVTTTEDILQQSNAVIRKITAQILTSLRDLHKTGIVHRDVKPNNLVLAKDSCRFKLIDLGAAVDLRSGYNYVPDETIMDPAYTAPERHVMPISTPKLPPDPLCSLVSPLVWLLNTPDRFDIFSVGVVLLQMAVKPLRNDVGLMSFNTEFRRVGYDLDLWRKRCRFSKEEFVLLDADGLTYTEDDDGIAKDRNMNLMAYSSAAGWELLKTLLQPRHDKDLIIWPSLGKSRPSAKAALRHRYLTGSGASFKGLQLPSFFSSLQPRDLISNFDSDFFHGKLSLLPRDLMSSFTFASLPKFSLKTFPRISLNWSPKLPRFSSILPLSLIPDFSEDSTLISLGDISHWFDINWRQAILFLGSNIPVAASSAFTLAIAWLVLWLLKESAQTSYAIGERSMKVVEISGVLGLSFIALLRLSTSSAAAPRDLAVNNSSQVLSEAPLWGGDISEQSLNSVTLDGGNISDELERSPLHRVKDLVAQSRLKETGKVVENASARAGAWAQSDLEIAKVLKDKRQTSTRKGTTIKGLVEIVHTMDMQLASLESSIVSDRVSTEQREEQIIQMEKLLKQRQPEPVTASAKFRT